ncbi:hypothetical protein F1880_006894 [Penicillium rolfsii]|nr:hypothetical protein F1880_006894 [Penicillium rolfsii]
MPRYQCTSPTDRHLPRPVRTPTHPSTASASLSQAAGSPMKKPRMEVKRLRAQVALLEEAEDVGCMVVDGDGFLVEALVDNEDMG